MPFQLTAFGWCLFVVGVGFLAGALYSTVKRDSFDYDVFMGIAMVFKVLWLAVLYLLGVVFLLLAFYVVR